MNKSNVYGYMMTKKQEEELKGELVEDIMIRYDNEGYYNFKDYNNEEYYDINIIDDFAQDNKLEKVKRR